MKKIYLVLGLFLMANSGLSALGQAEKPTLTGVVTVKGNAPFTFLALTELDGTVWKLTGPFAAELEKHQNARVRVEVKALPSRSSSPLVAPEVEVTRVQLLE